MASVGVIGVWVALAAALAGAVAPRRARLTTWVATAALLVSAAMLAVALARLDLSWVYVADYARRGVGVPYRIAGMWGGPDGSLLFFAALAALAATRAPGRAASATVAALVAILLVTGHPFRRLQVPAILGNGMQPILEHPGMLVHPPLLYLGATATVIPWALALAGRNPAEIRRWLTGIVVVLTVAQALGAHWAYVELGWGGYWGWDPVENAVLMTWIAALGALHLLPAPGRPRLTLIAAATPWLATLLGAIVTRGGIGGSIHAFADDGRTGVLLAAVTVVTVAATVWQARSIPRRDPRPPPFPWTRAVPAGLAAVAAVIIAEGLLYPIPAPGEPLVSGRFYAWALAPLALAALAGAAAAWRRATWPGRLAHAGFALLLVGIAATTFAEVATVGLEPGQTTTLGGVTFRHVGVEVVDGDDETSAVVATILVGDDELRPSLVAYRRRGVLLAETALRSRPTRDVQAVLRNATDAGAARYDLIVTPGAQLVWWGAGVIALGGVAALVDQRSRSRRRRVRSSSADIVAASSAAAASRSL